MVAGGVFGVVDDIDLVLEVEYRVVVVPGRRPLDGYDVVEVCHSAVVVGGNHVSEHPLGIIDHDADVDGVGYVFVEAEDVSACGAVVHWGGYLQGDRAQVLSLLGIFDLADGVLVVQPAHDGRLVVRCLHGGAEECRPLLVAELGAFSHRCGNLYDRTPLH